jgi:hypothetical protein
LSPCDARCVLPHRTYMTTVQGSPSEADQPLTNVRTTVASSRTPPIRPPEPPSSLTETNFTVSSAPIWRSRSDTASERADCHAPPLPKAGRFFASGNQSLNR